MKKPLIPKSKAVIVRKPLQTKISASLDAMSLINRLSPTGIHNDNPDAAIGLAYNVLNEAHSLELNKGPKAVNYFFADYYDKLFGDGSSDSVPDHVFIRNRVVSYLDILGRVGRDADITPGLKNRFIAAWTGDIRKLDDLSKNLWNIEKEIDMAKAAANTEKKEARKKREDTPRSHANLLDQITSLSEKYKAMGTKSPILAPMGKDGYRCRRDTKTHGFYLAAVKMAKRKHGCHIRNIYRLGTEMRVIIYKSISAMFAKHPEVFSIDPDTGTVTVQSYNAKDINLDNSPQELPSPTPVFSRATKNISQKPKVALKPVKRASPTAATPKRLKPVKKSIAAPAPRA